MAQEYELDSALRIGTFLRHVRERQGLKRAVVAVALDMGEQNIRYYEAGNRRIAAEDLARLAEAYRMTPQEREQLAGLLGLLIEPTPISEEEQDDLERLLADPSMRTFFSALSELGLQDMTDGEKRHILNIMRATVELRNQREN